VNLARLLLQIAVILALCRLLHGILRRMGQPPVIGEIIAGLLLGPFFLAVLVCAALSSRQPARAEWTKPDRARPVHVSGWSPAGSERGQLFRHVAGVAGLLSIVVPFSAGLALARPLHALAPQSPMLPFSLFIAVSMSITAFPVLARILSDQGLTETRLGHVSIACAALNDVSAWILLAWIAALTRSADGRVSILETVATVGVYGFLMACAVRPLLRLLTRHFPIVNELPVMLVIAFLSSWATEWIGIHALFGAFFAGVIWPPG
jgi:Kef-type K+ transport system membrane component KefB